MFPTVTLITLMDIVVSLPPRPKPHPTSLLCKLTPTLGMVEVELAVSRSNSGCAFAGLVIQIGLDGEVGEPTKDYAVHTLLGNTDVVWKNNYQFFRSGVSLVTLNQAFARTTSGPSPPDNPKIFPNRMLVDQIYYEINGVKHYLQGLAVVYVNQHNSTSSLGTGLVGKLNSILVPIVSINNSNDKTVSRLGFDDFADQVSFLKENTTNTAGDVDNGGSALTRSIQYLQNFEPPIYVCLIGPQDRRALLTIGVKGQVSDIVRVATESQDGVRDKCPTP